MRAYRVIARRIDRHGSFAVAKEAEVALDTNPAGRQGAKNRADLLLGALAICMLKGIKRMMPMLGHRIEGAEVRLEEPRQAAPPKLTAIHCEILVTSDEPDRRLDLLYRNVL